MIYRRVAVVASTLSRRFSALSALSALSAHRPAHTPQAAEALADLYHIDKDSEDERVAEVAVRHLFSYDLYVGSRGGESQHTLEAFARASQFVDHFYTERDGADGAGERYEGERDERVKLVILDSGCGVGHSTIAIAHQHPDIPVIGIDKSLHRLSKSKLYEPDFAQKAQTLKRTGPEAGSIVGVGATGEAGLEAEVGVAGVGAAAAGVTGVPTLPRNALLLRAELGDFYTLSVGSDWTVHSHHLLYPNPFPKAKHLRRRWHGHPAFPALLALGGQLVVRSNWHVYCSEMRTAVTACRPFLGRATTEAAEAVEAVEAGTAVGAVGIVGTAAAGTAAAAAAGTARAAWTAGASAGTAAAVEAAGTSGTAAVSLYAGPPQTLFEAKYRAVGADLYQYSAQLGVRSPAERRRLVRAWSQHPHSKHL